MAYKLISDCPVCTAKMKATRLECTVCGTSIENEFTLSKFDQLSHEQLRFVEIFLKSRGSIKDVEKELGISYPTVKGKLNEVIEALGYKIEEEISTGVKSVIDMLEHGEISPEEAVKKINEKN